MTTVAVCQSDPGVQSPIAREFFEAVAEGRIIAMRPAELLEKLRRLGLRTRIGNLGIPTDAILTGYDGLPGREILTRLRRQRASLTRVLSQASAARVRYFYQVQMCPWQVRHAMSNFQAVVFMPGGHLDRFPNGTTLWDLERLEVMSLGARCDCLIRRPGRKSFRIDHFDVRVLAAELIDGGWASLGGEGINPGGSIYSRVICSRTLSFEPGGDEGSIPSDRRFWTSLAIELHECLEMATADAVVGQSVLRLPALWLAFHRGQHLEPEYTEGLKTRAHASVLAWLRSGAPVGSTVREWAWAEALTGAAELIRSDPVIIAGWINIQQLLPAVDQKRILDDVWVRCKRDLGGYDWFPDTHFANDSAQRGEVFKVACDMEPFLGRYTTQTDGFERFERGLSAVQFIRLAKASKPATGLTGRWNYDLGGSELQQVSPEVDVACGNR